MNQLRSSPFENVFRSVRVAASNARLSTMKVVSNKRQQVTQRKNQAQLFALEEARLHEQVMIEQDIYLQQHPQQQEASRDTEQRQSPEATQQQEPAQGTEQREEAPQEIVVESTELPQKSDNLKPEEPMIIVLAPVNAKQVEKRDAIERKLEVIRQRLATPKKNAAGIANLRAAVAAF